MKFVSIEQAKLRLRIDNDAMDSDIGLMVEGASRAAMRYLGPDGSASFTDSAGDVFEDSNGIALYVPDDVKNAVLVMVGIWLRDPSGKEAADWDRGYLPAPVTALLYPLRKPSMA